MFCGVPRDKLLFRRSAVFVRFLQKKKRPKAIDDLHTIITMDKRKSKRAQRHQAAPSVKSPNTLAVTSLKDTPRGLEAANFLAACRDAMMAQATSKKPGVGGGRKAVHSN
jgi:hypothetical protein